MSLELVNTFATLGTFLVIAATAIAAIVQLRHARGSNLIAALDQLNKRIETSDFQAADRFVSDDLSAKLQDPAFRYQLAKRSARSVETGLLVGKINAIGNFYEIVGLLMKAGLVDTELALSLWSGSVDDAWERLAPVAAIFRRTQGPVLWENFEYVAVLAQDWETAHPKGTYPPGVRRIQLKDDWLEADAQYATSLAPA